MDVLDRMLWLPGWSFPGRLWSMLSRDFEGQRHSFGDLSHNSTASELRASVREALFSEDGATRIVGWSLGAMLALELARDHPDRVRALYLIGATDVFIARPGVEGEWPETVLDEMSSNLEHDRTAVLGAFYRQLFNGNERHAGVLRACLEELAESEPPIEALRAGLNFLRTYAFEPAGVTPPVFLLHGHHDAICSIGGAKRLCAGLAHAELTVIEEAGHAPFITHPAVFSQWLTDAIARS